ncbi:MAG TPA: HDOD domain-containing protein [Burkholderiales bacterium]|nr:HDOD domain-containing protein [Burkholderiales bacterium]
MNLDSPGRHPIERWIEVISAAQLPVLGQTLRQISKMRADEENVRPRDISQLVLHDPLMALRVLRFLKTRQSARNLTEITTVEHAIMMLGVSPFFRTFANLRSLDAELASQKVALLGLIAVVGRARHAALHAREWAQLRHDIESDEVVIATLLHDMAEMLLWYFAPSRAEDIEARLANDSAQRSVDVQRAVLGFGLNELQVALAAAWGLPPLITSLMDDYRAERPRARNVLLAVNLTRHSNNGWEDPALPDDIDAIRRLIGKPLLEVKQRIFHTALEAGRDHEWYGDRAPAMWLPPFPLDIDSGDAIPGPRTSTTIVNRVRRLLAADAGNELVNWSASGAPSMASTGPSIASLVALTFHGLYKGVGIARQVYFSLDETGTLARARYLGGVRDSSKLSRHVLPLGMANPLTRKLAEEGVVWWKGIGDEIALTDLTREWRIAGNGEGFLAGMVRTADGRGALLYCDTNSGSMPLNDERFQQFRDLCDLLSTKIAGPLPEPGEPAS